MHGWSLGPMFCKVCTPWISVSGRRLQNCRTLVAWPGGEEQPAVSPGSHVCTEPSVPGEGMRKLLLLFLWLCWELASISPQLVNGLTRQQPASHREAFCGCPSACCSSLQWETKAKAGRTLRGSVTPSSWHRSLTLVAKCNEGVICKMLGKHC